jgi:DNA-binding NarL/FixJ family response regulator
MNANPIRLAVVDDYEVVVNGLVKMLERYKDRVVVVELDTTPQEPEVAEQCDIVLYDTFGQAHGDEVTLSHLIGAPNVGEVVVYTWNFQPDLVRRSLEAGVKGYLSKTLPASELVAALERVHAGETIVSAEVGTGPIAGEWPGREEGLTPREAEVLALITQGLSNNEIAAQTHLSINSVKSYIRTGYRKIGVTSRSQAVLWGVRHGFEPDHRRIVAGSQNGL